MSQKRRNRNTGEIRTRGEEGGDRDGDGDGDGGGKGGRVGNNGLNNVLVKDGLLNCF